MAGTLFFKKRKLFFCSLKNTLLVEMFFIFGIIINTFVFAGLDRGCSVVDPGDLPHEGHLYPGEEYRHCNCESAIIYSLRCKIVGQASCYDTPRYCLSEREQVNDAY